MTMKQRPRGKSHVKMTTQELVVWYWENQSEEQDDGCILFLGQVNNMGYGKVTWEGKTHALHRLTCEAAYGPAPEDKPWALHKCGRHLCFNPEHLYWGTPPENYKDAIGHNRPGMCKLSEQDVRWLRDQYSQGVKPGALLDKFNMSVEALRQVMRGRTYRWVV